MTFFSHPVSPFNQSPRDALRALGIESDGGQSLAEFGLVLALVALVSVIALTAIGLAVLGRVVGIQGALV